ncbi:MAG: hypothetical protein QG622_1275 [Actinomycetota bacterium]|nr:hypothetical protein [Actinomycetota bacterium]
MSFTEAVSTCFSKYATFSGRARRSEFWYFTLFTWLLLAVGTIADTVVGTSFITGLVALPIFLPLLGVSVRRLHDTGRSGWFILLDLIPLIGGLILLVFYIQDTKPEGDTYGPSPKAPTYA